MGPEGNVFDLNIYPIHVKKSVEQLEMPGLMAANAPTRCARNRQSDLIVVMVSLQGEQPFSAMSIDQQLSGMIQTYFQSSGPVTSGLRSSAEYYNQILLDYNLNTTTSNRHILGTVNFAVVHNQDLYLAHSGVSYSYHLNQEAVIYSDNESAGKGLGLSRAVTLRFFHTEVQAGEYLLFVPQPPVTWTANNLSGATSVTLDTLRRRLFAQTPPDLRAVLVSVMDGSGMVNMQPVMSSHAPIDTPNGSSLITAPVAPSIMMSSAIHEAVSAKTVPVSKPISIPSISPRAMVDQVLHAIPVKIPAAPAPDTAPAQHAHAPRSISRYASSGRVNDIQTEVDTVVLEKTPAPRPIFHVASAISQPVPTSRVESIPFHTPAPRVAASTQTASVTIPQQPAKPFEKNRIPSPSRPSINSTGESPVYHTHSRRTGPRSIDELIDLLENKASNAYDQFVDKVALIFQPMRIKAQQMQTSLGDIKNRGKAETGNVRSWMSQVSTVAGGLGRSAVDAVHSTETQLRQVNPLKSVVIPPSAMIFMAVVIPLIVVAAASSIYFQKGRAEQYGYYLDQAKVAAGAAAQLSDPGEARKAWDTALFMVNKAETYQKTTESHSLLLQTQTVLDEMDNIVRVELKPAIVGGLPSSVNISRIEATQTDLYLLDTNQGRVLRAILTGRGYELDSGFKCNPGPYGSYIVSSLVDFRLLPKGNSMDAALIALDSGGNAVYCGPDISATSIALTPPENKWGQIKAIEYNTGVLYVLDTLNNAVWMYSGGAGGDSEKPEMFFTDNAPSISDVVDISVNGVDLYMLHADGHLSQCTRNNISGATKCHDQVAYGMDTSKNANNPVIIPDTSFQQIAYVDPPDPMLMFLDGKGQTIYSFSLRMTLHSKIGIMNASDLRIPKNQKPTGFTVNSDRLVFIAFDNQVYYGQIQ